MADFWSPRVPSALGETVAAYKKASSIVKRWLATNTCFKDQINTDDMNCEEVRKSIQVVLERKIEVPEVVRWALREAISGRAKATCKHTKNSSDDEGHEQFQRILQEFEDGLLKPVTNMDKESSGSAESIVLKVKLCNTLNELNLEDQPVEEADESGQADDPNDPQAKLRGLSLTPPKTKIILDIYRCSIKIEDMIEHILGYWGDAATGSVSLVEASWLTSTAFIQLERYIVNLPYADASLPLSITEKVFESWHLFHLVVREDARSRFQNTFSKLWRFHAEHHRGLGAKEEKILPHPLEVYTKPEDPSVSDVDILWDRKLAEESSALSLTLEGMDRIINPRTKAEELVKYLYDGPNDVLSKAGAFLLNKSQDRVGGVAYVASTVLSLQILTECHRIFIYGTDLPNAECGKKATELARAIISHVSKARECYTSAIYRADFNLIRIKLAPHASGTFSDFYIEHPYNVGFRMMAMLTDAADLGVRLCENLGCLPTLLHIYNMALQLHKLEKTIPILEYLSKLFLDAVFDGSRPTDNFSARHKQATGYGGDEIINRFSILTEDGYEFPDRCNAPSYVLRTPLPTDNGRLGIQRCSLLHSWALSTYGETNNPEAWNLLYQNIKKLETRKRHFQQRQRNKAPLQLLENLKAGVQCELTGEFPTARFNFLALFVACMDMYSRIADLSNVGSDLSEEEKGPYGLCALQQCIDTFDKAATTRAQLAIKKKTQEFLEVGVTALDEVFGSRETSTFFWEI